jgi:hypothetical protein
MKHLCAQGIVTSFRIDVPKAHPLSNASLVLSHSRPYEMAVVEPARRFGFLDKCCCCWFCIFDHGDKILEPAERLAVFPTLAVRFSHADPHISAGPGRAKTPKSPPAHAVGHRGARLTRMRWVVEALIALCCASASPQGFTASELARQVRLTQQPSRIGLRPSARRL